MYRTSLLSIAASLIASGVLLSAQGAGQRGASTSSQAPRTTAASANGAAADRTFVLEAAMDGMAEVEHGRLASEKGASAKVKGFGEQMIADHSKAGDELKRVAAAKQITLPAELDPAHRTTHDNLAKLSGAAFDRAYIADMVADHQKAVADFTTEATSGKDNDVKAWATTTLPTLRAHLKMAEDLQKEVGSSPAASPK